MLTKSSVVMTGLDPAIYRGRRQAEKSGVVHRSCRVKAGAARHRAKRGCGLDPTWPMAGLLAMRLAQSADRAGRWRRMTQTAPGLAIASDGVSGDQDLAHDGGQGDLTGPSVVAHQAVKKVFEGRGMARRGAGGIEEGAAHPGAAVASGLAKLGLA